MWISTIWPIRLDLSPTECRQILREKELLCYSDIVSVFRAQGAPSAEKISILANLQKILAIGDNRHLAEIRRAANDEELSTIAENVSHYNRGYRGEWAYLGSLKLPPTKRPPKRQSYSDKSIQTTSMKIFEEEKQLVAPCSTKNEDLLEKIEKSIKLNRFSDKNDKIGKSSVSQNTEPLKSNKSESATSSLDYNLHLLSEIATGETVETKVTEINTTTSTTTSTNNSTIINTNNNDTNIINMGHSSGSLCSRYILPPRSSAINIANIATTTTITTALMATGQQQRNFNNNNNNNNSNNNQLINNQMMRSPSITATQSQQLCIQQHHNQSQQQTMENLTSFGYTLQQRAARLEQHQIINNNISNNINNNRQNFIVRNLGSQPSMDSDRNKRFMVVKGGSSMGPSTKKPKISNPSNRQPGRPPLMPAPNSAYSSRPYVANEIFHTNRPLSLTDSPSTDFNGLKISSISSGQRAVTVDSSQMRPNSYFGFNRGNGVQKMSGSAVQLSQFTPHVRTLEPATPAVGSSNTLRPKNIQAVISIVPLSPRGHTMNDNTILSTGSVKAENIEQNIAEKDLVMPVKVISKDEVYANIMDRVNTLPILSTSHSENKI